MASRPNIDYMMKMTDEFIKGIIDPIDYRLDFPYEIELRFKAMRREHRKLADLIYDLLYEAGIARRDELTLSDEAFIQLIRSQYNKVRQIEKEGFW